MKRENKEDWFVLCTKARQELKVLERLSQLGIEAYAPTKILVKRWSDRKKKVKTCLLPSMVLVRLPINQVNEVIAMKNYLENKFKVDKQSKIEIGNNIDINFLKQQGEILKVRGRKCIVRLQMLGATMSLQLN